MSKKNTPLLFAFLIFSALSLGNAATEKKVPSVDFECVASGGGWRPQSKKYQRPLGSDPTHDQALCEKAVEASRNGVVCSFTSLGWKPTNESGYTPQRRDYGYFGSSATFRKCILATKFSTPDTICFCGSEGCNVSVESRPGERWYTNHPSGNGGTGGGYPSVESCVASTNPDYLKPEKKKEEGKKVIIESASGK